MTTRTKSLIFAGLFTALLVVSLVPAAEAQSQLAPACSQVADASIKKDSVSGFETKIKPISELRPITVKFRYTAEQQTTSVTQVPVDLSATVDKPWASVSLDTNIVYVPISQQSKTDELITVVVSVALTDKAPAFETAKITVTADPKDGTCVKDAAAAPAEITIQAGFFERWQARFEKTIHKTGQNSQITIPVTLDNLGNGPIYLTFKSNDQTAKVLSFSPPPPQIVTSPVGGGDTSKVTITMDVQTPFKNGYENRRDKLVLDIAGTSQTETSIALQGIQLTAIIQTQGVYVPGFDAVTMLGAALGAVFAVRRFR